MGWFKVTIRFSKLIRIMKSVILYISEIRVNYIKRSFINSTFHKILTGDQVKGNEMGRIC
jgi:hypothetical protein